MNKINLRSSAKINLYLEILRKRSDGYHELETIYQAINLYDDLRVSLRKDKTIKVFCKHPDVPSDSSNLAYKAADILLNKLNIKTGLEINIDKQIPVAAGLGGGSSNAASVILGLNKLLGLNLKKKDLLSVASEIGSDVSFFILEKSTALGSGRGDKLKALKGIPNFSYILVFPQIKVSSSWAYQNLKLNLTKKKPGVKICIRALKSGNMENIASVLYNDLEPAIEASYRQIRDIKEMLRAEGIKAMLVSGSGPCVFGIVQSRREAMWAKKRIEKKALGWMTFVCDNR